LTGKEKAKYRASSIWQHWRKYLMNKRGCNCEICGIPKKVGLNCHHADEKNYKDLKQDKFFLLCRVDHQNLERLLLRKDFDIDAYCENLKRIFNITKGYRK